jgi:hypothetical protein
VCRSSLLTMARTGTSLDESTGSLVRAYADHVADGARARSAKVVICSGEFMLPSKRRMELSDCPASHCVVLLVPVRAASHALPSGFSMPCRKARYRTPSHCRHSNLGGATSSIRPNMIFKGQGLTPCGNRWPRQRRD